MAAHQAPPPLGFSRQEHWSGLPFPSPMCESEKWKWSCSVVSDSSWPHGLQLTRLLHPWDFPGKSTGVGCHCLLQMCHEWVLNEFPWPSQTPYHYGKPHVGCGRYTPITDLWWGAYSFHQCEAGCSLCRSGYHSKGDTERIWYQAQGKYMQSSPCSTQIYSDSP